MRSPVRSNCVLWAITQRILYGGHLLIGRSPKTLIPRTYWLHEGHIWYYAPLHPKKGWKAYFHKIWFKGKPRRLI